LVRQTPRGADPEANPTIETLMKVAQAFEIRREAMMPKGAQML
jgi:DNA-binding phage protein